MERWRAEGVLTPEQAELLAGLARGEPVSVFLELNVLLYAGVVALVGGLGWTVSTWSEQLGDLLVLAVLTSLFAGCVWYCFSRAEGVRGLVFDYVLYFGCLTWSVELAFIEKRFHLLAGEWDFYLLASAVLFGFFAYRFDNRFVLSLALSSLAGWFGLTISHWRVRQNSVYRQYGVLYSLVVATVGVGMERRGWRPHFLGTYLHVATNVFFWAVLSGVFELDGYWIWFLALGAACGGSVVWGLKREYAFVAYAAVYGYVGVTSLLLRNFHDAYVVFLYFIVSGLGMVALLVSIARRAGRRS